MMQGAIPWMPRLSNCCSTSLKLTRVYFPNRCPLVEISDLGDEVVPGLIHALGHYDPVVRRMAAYSLAPHSLEHGPSTRHWSRPSRTSNG